MALTKALALAIAATFAMPSASSAAETTEAATAHKSYKNDRYGFAFDYPASWAVVEKHELQSNAALLSVKLLSPDEDIPVRRDYSPGSVSIEVFANPAQQPVREWLDKNGWPFDATGRSTATTAIGGLPALEVTTGKMFAPNRFTYVANKNWIFRLSTIAPESEMVVRSLRFNP